MTFSDLSTLSCGAYENYSNCNDVFGNIFNIISDMETRLLELPHDNDETLKLLGPFYARTLLENVCISLVGRFDPFRLLFVKNVQKQDTFGISSRSKAAIQWFGDIFEQGLDRNELVPEKMWSSNKEFRSIGRGLLGDYYGEVYWKPAFIELLDDETNYLDRPYLGDEFRNIPPEHFMSQIRQRFSGIYSSLSKGVHSELVIKADIIYDRTTVIQLVSDVMNYSAFLSLLSHKICSTICRLDFQVAVERYVAIKERSDRYGG